MKAEIEVGIMGKIKIKTKNDCLETISRIQVKKFLRTPLEKMNVIEISDGEIVIEAQGNFTVLYLNHELNEYLGFPKTFKIER